MYDLEITWSGISKKGFSDLLSTSQVTPVRNVYRNLGRAFCLALLI